MTGILAIWNDCAPGHEADYEQWYMRDHFPERLSVPGFRSGRRYEAVGGNPRYFTYYEVDAPAVLNSPRYMERLQNPSDWTRRIMQSAFRNMNRTVCERTAAFGHASGSHVAVARWEGGGMPGGMRETVAALAKRDGVAKAQVWAASGPPAVQTEESKTRGGDAAIGGALVIDCIRRADAESIAAQLQSEYGETGAPVIGIYAFLCLREAQPAA